MTIAIGILCADGGVIAADTEISSGDFTGSQTKVLAADGANKALGFAGAGDHGNIESIRVEMSAAIADVLGPDAECSARIKQRILEIIIPFFRLHIPFHGHREGIGSFDTLMIGWSQGKGYLWATQGTAPRQSGDFDAIGIGSTYANGYLTGLYSLMPTDCAALLASYVMMRTKNIVRDCGKETQIIIVREGVSKHLDRDIIQELECLWINNSELQKKVFHSLIGLQSDVKRTFSVVTEEATRIRQRIRDTSSSMDQT